jgi:hypothetical protein
MENLREVIRDLQDRLAGAERHLEKKTGYVSPGRERVRHERALDTLKKDRDEDFSFAKTREERQKARDHYEAAVEAENARHREFFEVVDTSDEGGARDESEP